MWLSGEDIARKSSDAAAGPVRGRNCGSLRYRYTLPTRDGGEVSMAPTCRFLDKRVSMDSTCYSIPWQKLACSIVD